MSETQIYAILADLVLVVHFSYVAFVVLGLLLVWVGYGFRLGWVRNFYFRLAHLGAMAIVVLESVFGVQCPLTTWESQLRAKALEIGADDGLSNESFMQYWIHKIMFFELSESTFTIIYCVFFAMLVLSFVLIPPRLPRGLRRSST